VVRVATGRNYRPAGFRGVILMTNQSTSSGVSTTGLLGVLFVGLKLGNVISWPWIWVLAPFWAPLILLLVIIVVYLFINLK
jgi:hypothetical protein